MRSLVESSESGNDINRRALEKYNLKEIAAVKQEILDVVSWIDKERMSMDKIAIASSKLAESLSSSSLSAVHAIKHRLKEVNIILDIQSIKRQSMKYNEELIRAYANSNCSVPSKVRRNLGNEHFKRAIPSKTTPKTKVLNDSRTSPWEGSDYKFSLVVSLKKKLLLKLIFCAIECYRQMRTNSRQAVFSADRIRSRKLLQLCFNSLRFEALTVRYIDLNSSLKCDMFIRRKYIAPTFTELYKKLYIAKEYSSHVNRVALNYFKKVNLGHSLSVLRENNKYRKRLRALKVWSKTKVVMSIQMKAFLSWMFAFIKKNTLRLSIQNKFSEGGQVLSKTDSDKLGRSILVDVKRSNADSLGTATKKQGRNMRVHLDLRERDEDLVTVGEFRNAVLDYSVASMRGMRHHIAQGRHYTANKSTKVGRNEKHLLVDTVFSEYFIRDFSHSVNISRDVSGDFTHLRNATRSWSVQDNDDDSVISDDSLSPLDKQPTKSHRRIARPSHRGAVTDSKSELIVPLPSLIPSHLRDRLKEVIQLAVKYKAAQQKPDSSMFSSIGGLGTPPQDFDDQEDYRRAVNDEFSLLDHHSTSSDSPSIRPSISHSSMSRVDDSVMQRGTVMEKALEMSILLSSPIELKQGLGTSGPTNSHFNLSFCGAIEDIDSDFESNVLNHHYGISRVDVERRKSIFEEKVLKQFQLLKFNWIIKKLRYFICTLRQMAKCTRGFKLTCQRHLRHCKDSAFSAWRSVYAKCRKEAELCYKIYCLKLSRRVLRDWHDFSVTRLRQCRSQLSQLCRLRSLKANLSVWKNFAERERMQRKAIESVNRVVMSHVWTTWMQLVRAKKRIYSLYKLVVLSRIRTRMTLWREKFLRRRLLKRVFTVCDTAWAYRSYYNTHHFYLLFNIFSAWSQYTRRNKQLQLEYEKSNRALYFRGVSLMVRYYFKWCDFVSQGKKIKALGLRRSQNQLKQLFCRWKSVLQKRKKLLLDSSGFYHRSLCRKVFRGWRRAINYVTTELPLEYKASKMLRDCFDAWKVLKSTRLLQTHLVPLWEGRLLHRSFHDWRALCMRNYRISLGLPVLTQVYYKIKMRQCFLRWPGRLECLRARQMLTYIQRKGKINRVRLVDVDQTVSETQVIKDRQLLDEERRKADSVAKSFIQQQRPSLTARAVIYRFVHGETDVEGIAYIFLLMSTVLKEWQSVVKSYRYYHTLAVKVRYLQRRHVEKMVLRHWMKLTPATTHRSITWIFKRHKRLHDDYEFHKKDNTQRLQTYAAKMDEEYKEYLNNLKTVKMQSLLMGV